MSGEPRLAGGIVAFALFAEREATARFLDAYAERVEKGPRRRESWEPPINQVDFSEGEKGLVATAVRGLASSIRAGLHVEEGASG
jgi:hypothetical protein